MCHAFTFPNFNLPAFSPHSLCLFSAFLLSESQPSVERIGVTSPPIRSDLRASAVLCADPDPHLLGLPDHYIPLGPTAVLVHRLEAIYRVRDLDRC